MEPDPQGENQIHLSDSEDFHSHLVDAGGRLVVVHFHSDESQPSREMMPKCKELAQDHKDVLFLNVNIAHAELAERYSVSVTPTFLFLKGGKTVEMITGANERRLEELVQKLKN